MTIKQLKYFFELCKQAGVNADELKEKTKKKYNKEHFNTLTTEELNPVISELQKSIGIFETPSRVTPQKDMGDFPNEFRVWEKERQKMYYGKDAITIYDFQPDKPNDLYHVMQWTGIKDFSGNKIYDFDYVKSAIGKIYLVQWGWKDCGWVAHEEGGKENFNLSSFSQPIRVGSIYEEVKV